ncbi:hypothetical protein [Hydrogenophaga sp. BPS33]|uniref:hypothetical protein n=1 Tax=Hydrogenophaga sp. BPS33 TaxID=2651974 RepID=UPI0013202266|nr:hypothetical protein [Hydrogenophaga sp. BPS33]QHE85854.1 hypothetical protein F9K07_13540 [Hydrogenophaga sp. BPS33]
MTALQAGNMDVLYAVCLVLPDHVPWEDHLPMPDPEKLSGDMTAVATRYTDAYGEHDNLLAYAQWCDELHLCMKASNAVMSGSESLKKSVPDEVRELCVALRQMNETADEASLKEAARSIVEKLGGMTAQALAHQTYASPRMMLEKCETLARYCARPAFEDFRSQLAMADRMREDSLTTLQQAMRMVQPKWSRKLRLSDNELVGHCVNVYAHFLSTPAVDPVLPSVTREQLDVMAQMLGRLLVQSKNDGRSALEIASLNHVWQSVMARLDELN